MKALLIGGPKHGKVLELKGGFDLMTYHEGRLYEYKRRLFAWLDEATDAVWPIFVHGAAESDTDTLARILMAEIPSAGKASDLPPETAFRPPVSYQDQ